MPRVLRGDGRGKPQSQCASDEQTSALHEASPRGRTLTIRIIPACMW